MRLGKRIFIRQKIPVANKIPNPIAPKGFRLDVATKMALEADKKRDMSEPKASLSRFRFQRHFCGHPSKRGGIPRSPFFAYFLWRSKESERLPGRSRPASTER
jgi:hypothetical protein